MLDQMKMLMKARAVQKDLKNTEVDAESPGGLVKATVNGEMKLKTLEIDETLLEPGKKRELERLIIDTVGEGFKRAQQVAAEKTREVMKDLGVNLPGM